MIDYGLRNPTGIQKIEAYELPSDDALIMQEVHEHEASGTHGAGAAGRLIAARSQMVKGKTSGVPPPLTLCALPAGK